MKKDLTMIKKIAAAMKGIDSSVCFDLPVKTDVDILIAELSKCYKVYRYNVQLTNNLSINIWNA